jgi:hypothetical protein
MASEPPLPALDPSLPPRFHEMDEYKFQRFVTDLYAYEPDIATSDEYGQRGHSDDGADVIARRNGGDGQEVASCKRYERTSAPLIRQWSDEFLEHWDDHWRTEDIRRFVLATTAVNTASRTVQDQISRERARFADLGMLYEVWGPATLVVKVRPYRAVAVTYLNAFWADQICGPAMEPSPAASATTSLVSAALIGQLADLQARLSDQAVAAAERAADDLRAGRTDAVHALIEDQQREPNWSQLDVRAQAKVLRLAASLALREQDIDEAERLSLAADALAPQDEPRLAAHIALDRGGADAALVILSDVTSAAGLQLRVALRVMTDALGPARHDLAALVAIAPDDPETIRMEALVALGAGATQDALMHMRRAEAVAPDWTAVRQLGAIARYACALSPALGPEWYLSPNPFDGAFVREDAASQALLAEALTLVDRVVASEPTVFQHRLWRLAILASLRAERERARAEAADLLARHDHDPTVVAWCMFRAIDVDLAASEDVLLARYADGADQMTVRILALLLARRENVGDAADLLRAGLDRQTDDGRAEAEVWIARFAGEAVAAVDPREGIADGAQEDFNRARADGDWTPVAARLAALMAAVPPDPGALALAEGVAGAGQFGLLAPHVETILAFRTATAVRIAAHTAYRTGASDRALAILDAEAGAFGEALPPDMRRLRADALARTGDIQAALREADVVASSGATRDRLFRAELMSSAGNLRGAIPAVREALDAGLLEGSRALHWSRMMRAEDPALAQRLLEHAISTEIDDDHVVAAMHAALTLQLGPEADALMARMHARAMSGADDVRILTIEDLPGLIADQQARANETEAMYLDGALPVHLFLAQDPTRFALLHLGPNRAPDGTTRPWPIRHGARQACVEYDLPWSQWRLHLDISALLVAARLELLEAIESHPSGVAIAADVPLLLLVMETGCHDGADASAAERIMAEAVTPAGLDSADLTEIRAASDPADLEGALPLATLIDALVAARALEADVAGRILDGLDARSERALPPHGAALKLDALSLQRLAAFDILSVVTSRYDVRCDGLVLDQARIARDEAAASGAAAATLAALRTRIAVGLESGIYRLMPRNRAEGEGEDDDGDRLETPITRCLEDILSAPAADGAMAWIDDRLVTGYAHTATMPVVGVSDVLEALHRDGRIDDERQRAALAALRAAGALFLVPTADEILAALVAAPHHGQRIVETPALEAIRHSLAFFALHERHLAVAGRGGAGRPDEVTPMQSAMRLLANCLKGLWLDNALGFDQRIALSDWLWLNARRTHVGRLLDGVDVATDQNLFEVIQIAHCLDQAVDIGLINDSRRSMRLDYQRWFWFRAVDPLLAADDSFEQRLARYLADFYAGMDEAYAERRPPDRRILHMLLAIRVQRLPDPVQNALYRYPRMSAFGTTRENVTVAGADFEAGAFWRAIRQALKYGRANLHFRRKAGGRPRIARLRRDGDGVIFSGGLRARIGDEMLAISALDGAARAAAIDRVVAGLRLEPERARDITARAVAAPSVNATVHILNEASGSSAAHRYDEAARRLMGRERVRLDRLAPAPFASLLAAMGVTDTAIPFADALDAARRVRDAADVTAGLRETAGVPVLRGNAPDGFVDPAVLAQTRTPMALIHVAAGLRSLGRAADEIVPLVERFLASVDRYGRLFTALLRWTHRNLLRDPAWRSAPEPFALAAIWAHADRILDIAIRGGLEPDPLRQSIEGFEPDLAGIDLLSLQPGPPDVTWPSWISPAALIHHGLAAIFGDDNPRATLGDSLSDRLAEAQLSDISGFVSLEPRLLLRRADWPNAMGSFLTDSPAGLAGGPLDRDHVRNILIIGALDRLDTDPDNLDGWNQLGGFAAGGLDDDAYERLLALVAADPARLARLAGRGASPMLWRSILSPIALRDTAAASRLARAVVLACRRLDEYRLSENQLPVSPDAAADELVELAALIAGCAPDNGSCVFAGLLDGFASAWPILRASFHQAVGNLTARTPSGRVHELWVLQNRLGAR